MGFPANKGHLNGCCNRSACLRPGAAFWNTSTQAYYCADCARDITNFAKAADGFHVCFPTTGDEATDQKTYRFGFDADSQGEQTND